MSSSLLPNKRPHQLNEELNQHFIPRLILIKIEDYALAQVKLYREGYKALLDKNRKVKTEERNIECNNFPKLQQHKQQYPNAAPADIKAVAEQEIAIAQAALQKTIAIANHKITLSVHSTACDNFLPKFSDDALRPWFDPYKTLLHPDAITFQIEIIKALFTTERRELDAAHEKTLAADIQKHTAFLAKKASGAMDIENPPAQHRENQPVRQRDNPPAR